MGTTPRAGDFYPGGRNLLLESFIYFNYLCRLEGGIVDTEFFSLSADTAPVGNSPVNGEVVRQAVPTAAFLILFPATAGAGGISLRFQILSLRRADAHIFLLFPPPP